ncbi:sufE-like protein 2, chloroplastic [Phalaenopsis equestris]|uniref:sufE-like protein 2, chloroplastic n=1 Tax=Phalaenopsis equestris TaxID=78828 RepID=UPI0009E338EE|nr:sufE-like protein 2, chloroplastic [Phalaenopsis equestris]
MGSSTLSPQLAQKPYTNHKQTPFRFRTLSSRRSPPSLLRCSAAPRFSAAIAVTAYNPALRLHLLSNEFRSLHEPIDRVKRLLFYAADLPPFPDSDRIPSNRVTGCTAQVWLSAWMDSIGRMRFAADSDSEIARGFCACLLSVVDGTLPEDVLAMRAEDLADLNIVGLSGRTHSRVNTWHNVLVSMQKRARALMGQGEGRSMVDPFPSLVLGGDGISSKTIYTEAQVSVPGQSLFHGLSSMET